MPDVIRSTIFFGKKIAIVKTESVTQKEEFQTQRRNYPFRSHTLHIT